MIFPAPSAVNKDALNTLLHGDGTPERGSPVQPEKPKMAKIHPFSLRRAKIQTYGAHSPPCQLFYFSILLYA